MIHSFQFNLPVNLIFGCGTVSMAGTTAASYGRRALLVTGRSSSKKSGLLDRVTALLETAGVEIVLFDRVSANPLTTTAQEAAEAAKSAGCDLVLGLGGGSIMDCAKAAAFLAVNEGDISDYIFGRKSSDRALPIVLIPTTCGTGSEGNGFAVLTNPRNGDKKSLRCTAIMAKASIIDPDVMQTMPKPVLASVGFDALCHCMEAYLSRNASPLTDAWCLLGMRLISGHLVRLCAGSTDPDDWSSMALASTIGGMVIGIAGVTLAHGMEHPASGLKNIVHGRGLAALTPIVMEKTAPGAPEKCGMISRILGGTGEKDCAMQIRDLLARLDLTCTLSELGLRPEDAAWMTDNCLKVSAAGIALHPVVFRPAEIRAMYLEAM